MKSEVPAIAGASPDLEAAVGVISGKWKIRIICLLFDGTKRFGELRRLLEGVHRGTLTYELRGLEADGIVQRTQYLTIPPTVVQAHGHGSPAQTSIHSFVAMESGQQEEPARFTNREQVGNCLDQTVSFGCFREDRCRESLDTVDLDIVE